MSRGGLVQVLRGRRALVIAAMVVTVAGVLAATQIADASSRRRTLPRACASPTTSTARPTATTPAPTGSTGADPSAGSVPDPGQTEGDVSGGVQNGRQVQHHVGDGQGGANSPWRPGNNPSPCPTTPGSTGTSTSGTDGFLGDDCSKSTLPAHTGFQDGGRCVGTEFGEVGTADKNPTLLITRSPDRVRVGQGFTIQVSTRNLVRDRFLAAGTGGYYKESSFLTAEGLVRGHFHTACRMLSTTRGAPDPAPVPAFFVATQDGGGGAEPDVITINVSGMPSAGIAQCAAWAGDGSHRIPMMQRANEIPAFDSVRIIVF